jgi:hypothetical protein
MQVLLDDMAYDVKATTVGEAIDAAAALAEQRGRLIVDVSVDGVRLTESELSADDRRGATADTVRFTSAAPVELVRQIFADAADALRYADELQREAAELLQSDRHTASFDRLNEAISIWLQVREAIVKGSQLVGLDLDEIQLPRPIHESINALNEQLEAIRGALAEHDDIALADTLLYELPEVVEEWRCVLEELQRRLGD